MSEEEHKFTPEEEEWLKEILNKADEMIEGQMPPEIKRFVKPIWYKLDENKNPVPCSTYEFTKQHQDFEKYKRVGLTKIGPYSVTTVFLGIDHNWSRHGKPILFETMIWSEKTEEHVFFNSHQWRYCTWQEAKDGHNVIVKLVEEGILP